jgi:hypothetical protein
MSLPPNAREANFKDSWKKHIVDNLETTEGINVGFDRLMPDPDLFDKSVDRWVQSAFGLTDLGYMSNILVTLYLCTRKDPEYFRLAQLKDTVMGYLSDTTTTDGMKRIPFYRSKASGAWELLGAMLVQEVTPSQDMDGPDDTKWKSLSIRLRVASQV